MADDTGHDISGMAEDLPPLTQALPEGTRNQLQHPSAETASSSPAPLAPPPRRRPRTQQPLTADLGRQLPIPQRVRDRHRQRHRVRLPALESRSRTEWRLRPRQRSSGLVPYESGMIGVVISGGGVDWPTFHLPAHGTPRPHRQRSHPVRTPRRRTQIRCLHREPGRGRNRGASRAGSPSRLRGRSPPSDLPRARPGHPRRPRGLGAVSYFDGYRFAMPVRHLQGSELGPADPGRGSSTERGEALRSDFADLVP